MVTEHCQGNIAEPPMTSNDLPWYGGVLLCWLVCWLVLVLSSGCYLHAGRSSRLRGTAMSVGSAQGSLLHRHLAPADCSPLSSACKSLQLQGTGMLPCDSASAYRQFSSALAVHCCAHAGDSRGRETGMH